MRSGITRLALALALLSSALRAQPSFPGLVRYLTFATGRAHEFTSLFTDDSDNCISITWLATSTLVPGTWTKVTTYQIVGTPVNTEKECSDVVYGGMGGNSGLAPIAPQLQPRFTRARPNASSTPPGGLSWIGSTTPPSTAPTAAGAVYVVNPSTFDTVASIPLPGNIADSPTALATNHAGTYVYAVISAPPAAAMGPAMIAAIDASSYSIAQTINLPQGVSPGIPALSADDRYLYVPNSGPGGGVLVIDTQNPSSITTIPTTVTYPKSTEQAAVEQAAVTPDGELLFTWGSNNFFIIDTKAGQQIGQILLPTEQGNQSLQTYEGTGINYFVVDPTGSRIYAFANYGSGPSNTFTGYLYAYDTASLSMVGSVELGQDVDLDSIAITPDGSTIFVGAFVYADGTNPIFAVDAQSLAVSEANLSAPPLSESDTGLWQTMLLVLQ